MKRLPDASSLQAQRPQPQSACEEETGGEQSCGSQQGGKVETGTCVVGNGNLKGPGQDAADQRLLWGQGTEDANAGHTKTCARDTCSD